MTFGRLETVETRGQIALIPFGSMLGPMCKCFEEFQFPFQELFPLDLKKKTPLFTSNENVGPTFL